MPLSGPQVLQQLHSAYNGAATRLEQQRAALTEAMDDVTGLEQKREESLSELARFYLPSLSSDAIAKTLVEVRPAMRDVLLRKQHRERELSERLQTQREHLQAIDSRLKALNERLDEAEASEDQLMAAVETDLRGNERFVQFSDRAALAEAALERAEANLDEVSQDAARKLPAYDECKLFQYLKERGYGTSKYTQRGFSKRMDRWIARMVDYPKSKRSYDFLRDTPSTMRKIMAEDRAALETVLNELESMRDESAARMGLTEQIGAREVLQADRKELLGEADVAQEAVQATEAELNELCQPDGAYYQEAIDVFRGMLGRLDSKDLRREARRTMELTDDQIVASIRGVEAQIDRHDDEMDQRQDNLRLAEQIHSAVGRLIQRFRGSGFDKSRAMFHDTLDLMGELDRLRHPADVEDLWVHIRRAQSWGPTTMDRVTQVATHPMTQVLVNAMAHAAAGAMQNHARRAGRRRLR
ncbi:MAG: hypothetical protein AAGD07_09870 [Planctomycetota bacterium]